MDRVEELVRGELSRLADGPHPDTERLLDRVRRRRRAVRAMVAAVAVLVATTGTVVAVSLLRPRPQPADPDRPRSLAHDGGVFFATDRQVFRLVGACPPGRDSCDVWLAASDDTGRTWRWHRVGDATYRTTEVGPYMTMPYMLRALDARRMVVGASALPLYGEHNQWYTADGGKTWTLMSDAEKETIDEIPVPARAQIYRPLNEPARIRVLRADGTWARLRAFPDGVEPSSYSGGAVFGSDGSVWFEVTDKNDKLRLFVSHDRGRSWRAVPLPAELGRKSGTGYINGVVTVDGRTVYLVNQHDGQFWRTRDEGEHWQGFAIPRLSDQDLAMGAVGLDDGGLVVFDNGFPDTRFYRLDASGDHLEPLGTHPFFIAGRLGAVLVAVALKGFGLADKTLYWSRDGRTWTRLNF